MSKPNKSFHAITYLFLICGAILMIFPIVWMVSTSLKTGGALLEIPPSLIPNPINWSNYSRVWVDANFSRYTMNSVLVTIAELVGVLLSCSIVAYGLAMFKFKGHNLIFLMMIATLVLPGQITLIPSYFIWKVLGGLDSYYPLIVPAYLGKAFGIFLMHQFFKSLPKELYYAAHVDGANPLYIFWKIYLPLSKPALGALAIFTFMSAWNDTLGPLIYVQNKDLYTLPLALLYLKKNIDFDEPTVLMAGAVITTLPVLLVFLVMQKHFIKGIASGGVKG